MIERFQQLAQSLGVELGPLTAALSRLDSSLPQDSLLEIGTITCRSPIWGCDFYLDFPEPFQHITPSNVLLFGSTGVDCNQFGFVMPTQGSGTTDELVVALVRPKGDEVVLAPNLAAFLSLVATAGTEAIDADMTDEDYAERRAQALEDTVFRDTSLLLCSLPGVSIPASPSALLRQCPPVQLQVERAPPCWWTSSWTSGI
jgi:hypothetical protein